MNDAQLLRYSRHILLPEIGYEGQCRLVEATVMVVGLGGLGSPVALYLAAAGIGHLILVDDDNVDETNLQRQVLYSQESIGQPKTVATSAKLKAMNPSLKITRVAHRPSTSETRQLAMMADVVVDCSDNFATRYCLNQACMQTQTPWIMGGATRLVGQVTTIDPRLDVNPCYACLYPDAAADDVSLACSEQGVLASLVGIVGSMQATEAMKLVIGLGTGLVGRLLMVDANKMDFKVVPYTKDPACLICA